jgi:hypothetical protein
MEEVFAESVAQSTPRAFAVWMFALRLKMAWLLVKSTASSLRTAMLPFCFPFLISDVQDKVYSASLKAELVVTNMNGLLGVRLLPKHLAMLGITDAKQPLICR